ncbi:hypothetical protein [Amycolatopsis sp. H20-H5]|uniref:hypothetical protein n=1 Tax=Amycolatopsis sp. H20-H5 TaxID=3046309 RepID=UPI002DBA39F0|nr:hypothetical protein [Amycolatopsis sp. H20-H5]MEC3979461.1 hypothetical protein [Amycolatopsis sp. H20-H5]
MVLFALRQEVGAQTFERVRVAEHHDSLGDTEQYVAPASRAATSPRSSGHPDGKPAPAA